jgi:hypothetical protein
MSDFPVYVMAGLDPAIHPLLGVGMDGRLKGGHDEKVERDEFGNNAFPLFPFLIYVHTSI